MDVLSSEYNSVVRTAANGAILLRKPLFAQAPHLLLYSVEVTFYDRTELMSFSSSNFKGKNEPQKSKNY